MGARLPELQRGKLEYVRNEFGREVVSRFDRRVLQQIAANGEAFMNRWGRRRGPAGGVRARVVAARNGQGARKLRDYCEYFQWPLGLAVGCSWSRSLQRTQTC